jgi:MinD-like ATPase involved in chromosome partitioning or flagellar assembly
MSKVLLISRSHEYEVRLKQLLGADVASVMGALITLGTDTVLGEIGKKKPSIVLVGPNLSFDAASDIVAGVRHRFPHLRVALVHEVKKEIGSWTKELGADTAIGTTATDKELLDLVETLSESDVIEIAPPVDGAPSRVIAVIAPKGGLGKTTVATNLAAGLARSAPDSVVLVDADVQFGDVATVLGLTPAHTLPDMVTGFAPRDTMVLKTLLTPHPAGFYVVGGAESPEDGDRVSGDQLVHLIEQLSDIFPYVIVDTSPGLGEHALSVIESATDAIMLCSLGVPNLRALRKELTVLNGLGLLPQSSHIVLNLADKTSGLNRRDAEATIGRPVDIEIPRSSAVPLSTNRGVPVIEDSPRDAASRSLMKLVSRISGADNSRSVLPSRNRGVA